MKSLILILLLMISSFISQSRAEAGAIGEAFFALDTSLLSTLLAKEMCSCIYVTGADQRLGLQPALETCLDHANLPVSKFLLNLVVKKSISLKNDSVVVKPTVLAKIVSLGRDKTGVAHYDRQHPEYGCSLVFKANP